MALVIRDIVLLALLIAGTALVGGLLGGLLARSFDWPPDRIPRWTGHCAWLACAVWWALSLWLLHRHPLDFLLRDLGKAAEIFGLFAWMALCSPTAARVAQVVTNPET